MPNVGRHAPNRPNAVWAVALVGTGQTIALAGPLWLAYQAVQAQACHASGSMAFCPARMDDVALRFVISGVVLGIAMVIVGLYLLAQTAASREPDHSSW